MGSIKRSRFAVAALGLAFLWVGAATGADDKKPPSPARGRGDRPRLDFASFGLRPGPLLTREEKEQLKLSYD